MGSEEQKPGGPPLKRKKDVSEQEQSKRTFKKLKKGRRQEAESTQHPKKSNRAGLRVQSPGPVTDEASAAAITEQNRLNASKKRKHGAKKDTAARGTTKSFKSDDKIMDQEAEPEPGVAQAPEPSRADETPSSTRARFIVFVGNLPYTTTLPALELHFSSIKPAAIRHRTKKDDPSVSRGFAFLEFARFDSMRTCLKLYHHSMFDDGKTAPRRINVELTAGGGGRGRDRKEKLKVKNQRLGEQRKRKKENADLQRGKAKGNKDKKTPEDAVSESIDAGASDIHPSRRFFVDGA